LCEFCILTERRFADILGSSDLDRHRSTLTDRQRVIHSMAPCSLTLEDSSDGRQQLISTAMGCGSRV